MEHLQGKLENEKGSQLTKLKDEIAKRRKRKQEKKHKELEASAAIEETERQQADEQEQQELIKMNEQQANELRQHVEDAARQHVEDAARPTTPGFPLRMSENVSESKQPTTILHPPPPDIPDDLSEVIPPKIAKPQPKPAAYNVEMGEQDLSNLLMSTPLFNQLSEIEAIVKLQGAAAGDGIQVGPYIDLKDAQWVCTGDLVAVDIEKLRPTNFVVYRFGVL